MGKYYCKKCGSNLMFIETKGNNTGLYCGDCGLWQKWLSKDELRAFDYSLKENKSNIEGFQCGICKHYETRECNFCQRNYEDLFVYDPYYMKRRIEND